MNELKVVPRGMVLITYLLVNQLLCYTPVAFFILCFVFSVDVIHADLLLFFLAVLHESVTLPCFNTKFL